MSGERKLSQFPDRILSENSAPPDFHGTKLAILVGDRIVTILRDDFDHIPYPAHWDLPGGGREGAETPEACVLRELHEELGINYSSNDLIYAEKSIKNEGTVWFFATEQPGFKPSDVTFGNEGQRWTLATIDWFMDVAKAVPYQQEQVRRYLKTRA